MTRAEAVNWLINIMPDIGKSQHRDLWHYEQALAEIKKILEEEQHWIPCERELPEVGQSVLISVGGMYTAEGCLREDGNWAQFRWNAVQRKDMVGAWMPLLEPWKG